jgi:hypothetical protein
MKLLYKSPRERQILAALAVIVAFWIAGSTTTHAEFVRQRPLLLAAWQRPMAIDGVWILSTSGKHVRIHHGRSFADESWLGVARGKQLSRDIHPIGRATFGLYDLLCGCRAEMKMAVDGTLNGVSHGVFGPVGWTLTPVYLDHPEWFRHELRQGSGGY